MLRRVSRTARPEDGEASLATKSPVKVVVFYRRDGVEERRILEATIPAAHLVELAYAGWEDPNARAKRVLPTAQAEREGRTEPHALGFRISVEGVMGDFTVEPVIWTRPGQGTVRGQILLPSRLGEEIPFGTEVELAAMVVADRPGATLELAYDEAGRTVPRLEPPTGPEDRLHVMRLILRVEAADGGRSQFR